MDMGISTQWTLAGPKNGPQYVRANSDQGRGDTVQISRLITGAGYGQIVRYRDRNTLNLQRDNLIVTVGHGMRKDRDVVMKWLGDKFGDKPWVNISI